MAGSGPAAETTARGTPKLALVARGRIPACSELPLVVRSSPCSWTCPEPQGEVWTCKNKSRARAP